MTARKKDTRLVSSYQKQKRRTAFYVQRGEDLESIIDVLCKQLCDAGIAPMIPLGTPGGIEGDRVLNDISVGDFGMRLVMKYQTIGSVPKPFQFTEFEPVKPWWKFW